MRKKWKHTLSIIVIIAMVFTGCASKQTTQQESTTTGEVSTTGEVTTTGEAATVETTSTTTSQVVVEKEFSARDLEVGYEDSTACQITLEGSTIDVSGNGATAKDGVLTISEEGTYVLTGTLTDGQIVVDAEDTDKVQIVLKGVSITNTDNAPIYIKNADKVFITLEANTENTLIDGKEYTQTDDNTVDAVIFSKADLTLNGDGTLNITGNYQHGIASKDDLIITGGTYNIIAAKDALNGKDCVKIKAGTLNLSATTGNGIQSKNGDDTTKGYVYISGAEITISKCQEGIEGTAIIVEDGTINITAEDDGLNAASGKSDTTETSTTSTAATEAATLATAGTEETEATSEATTEAATRGDRVPGEGGKGGPGGGGGAFETDTNCYISISGGTLNIDASGDGIDSNGNLYIAGGTTYVSGPTNSGNGAMDYNGTAEITGGTVVISGSTGMAQGFSDTSSQYSLLYNLTTVCEAGTEVTLADKDGKVVASYTPNKEYQSVVISTPDLTKDAIYTLTCGDQTAEITLASVVTSNGQEGMGGQGMTRPDMEGKERPVK